MDIEEYKLVEDCIICIEELLNNIVILSCHHRYHYHCIQQWFLKKGLLSCPLCCKEVEIVNIINPIIETNNIEEHNNNCPCCIIL